jgi:hypothetical protein
MAQFTRAAPGGLAPHTKVNTFEMVEKMARFSYEVTSLRPSKAGKFSRIRKNTEIDPKSKL